MLEWKFEPECPYCGAHYDSLYGAEGKKVMTATATCRACGERFVIYRMATTIYAVERTD